MTPRADPDKNRWASRAVQALFLIALISFWYFLTASGRVSAILRPDPSRGLWTWTRPSRASYSGASLGAVS